MVRNSERREEMKQLTFNHEKHRTSVHKGNLGQCLAGPKRKSESPTDKAETYQVSRLAGRLERIKMLARQVKQRRTKNEAK